MLFVLIIFFIVASCDDSGPTSLFDCQVVSFNEIYSRDIKQSQRMSDFRFSTTYPPYGSVDVNTCSINKYSGHDYQFVAMNAVNGYRMHIGLAAANFDCVGTVRSDPVALFLYANNEVNPSFLSSKKCYGSVSQNLFVDAIKVRRQRKENTDGNLIYKIVDELIESKDDSHLVTRRKLLDYRMKDFISSAVGGKNPDDYVYYVFVTTSRSNLEKDGFVSYPPPGYANIDWIKGPMSFHHYKISENVKMSVKNKAGESVSFTMSLDPLNDTYINPGISFKFDLTLKEKYTINVYWTNKGEKFNYTYGFFVINDKTKIDELDIQKCDLTNPPYDPVEAAGTSTFNCRTLSYSPLYKRSLNDLINRYVSVYGSTSNTAPTKISQSNECDLNHNTESSNQNRGLEIFNFYRYYIGATDIGYNADYQSACDKSGIFSLVNNIMDHKPTDGKCYSEETVKCLSESNLARGYSSIEDAYTGWMIDRDSASVGHRRFMMNPLLNATTISALQIDSNSFYVQRIMDYNNDVQGISPFYAYPPPGFAIKAISPSLSNWNSFHHNKIKDDNLKVKVVDQLGGEVGIRTSKNGLTSDQPLPCILWQFNNEPMIGKQYTITVSWKSSGADFIFNYTIIYVNTDTKVTIREPTQCSVKSNNAMFDCEVVSNHSSYLIDYTYLKDSYEKIIKELPSNVDDYLHTAEYSNGWKVNPDVYRKGEIISNVMYKMLKLIRNWIGSSDIENGYYEYMSTYANISDRCYSILLFAYPKYVPDQTMCSANCLLRYNQEVNTNECSRSGIFSSGKTVMDSFYNLISSSGWALENRRSFFDYSLLKATFASVIYPLPDKSNEYETLGNFRHRDRSKLSDNFIAYPPPGIALKELIHGDFSFHHDGLSTPITLKIWNKAGEEVSYTANFDGVYQYVFKGFSYKIDDLKIGERYTVEVTWDGGGINYDYKYLYYYVDINTSPQLNPNCKYDPNYKPTEPPTLPPRTEPPKPTVDGGKSIAVFSYDSKSYIFEKGNNPITINPSEKYDDVKFVADCSNKDIVSIDENGSVSVITTAVGISICTITCSGDKYQSYTNSLKIEIKDKVLPKFDEVNSIFPKFIKSNEAFNINVKLTIPNDISIIKYPLKINLTISNENFDNIEKEERIVDGLFEATFNGITLKPKGNNKEDVYVEISIDGIDKENNNLPRLRKSIAVILPKEEECSNPDKDGLCCDRNVELGESCSSLVMKLPFTSTSASDKLDNKFVKDFNITFYETIIKGNPFKYNMSYSLSDKELNITFTVKYYSKLDSSSKSIRMLDGYSINWNNVQNPLAFVEILVDKMQDDSIEVSSFIQNVLGVEDEYTAMFMNAKIEDQSSNLKSQTDAIFATNNIMFNPNTEIIKETQLTNIPNVNPDLDTSGDDDEDSNGGGDNSKKQTKKNWAKDNWWVILIICIVVVVILMVVISVVVYANSPKKESNKNVVGKANSNMKETKISIDKVKDENGVNEKDIYKPFTSSVIHEGYLIKDGNKRYCVITFEPALFRIYETMVVSTYGNVYLGEQGFIKLDCFGGILYKDNSKEFTLNLKVKDKKVKCLEPGNEDMSVTLKSCGSDNNSIEDIKKWVESFRDFANQVPHIVHAWTSSTALIYDKDGKLKSPQSQSIEEAVERAKLRKDGKSVKV